MLGILVVAGSLASVALAHADPAPLPAAASGGWQSLVDPRFGSGEVPTGRCGSAPQTPVCAVEQYLTCAYRSDAEPCREVAPDSRFMRELSYDWDGHFFNWYRVTASQAVRPGGQRGPSAASAVKAGGLDDHHRGAVLRPPAPEAVPQQPVDPPRVVTGAQRSGLGGAR